jgi:nucleoside-diphosphate-sugar epimerase
MNPAYFAKEWARELPRIQSSLVTAAGRAGARLVVLDNVYMLGKPNGKSLSEARPLAPCSKKGEIRARLHEELFSAVKRGDVRAVKGHASDFYGPRGVGTHFADRFWKPAFVDKTVRFVVNVDVPHTYHFIPDVAAGLAALGLDPEAEGAFMLPCQPAVTTRQLAERLAKAFGRAISISRMPPFLLKVLALGMPILAELNEMAYQWEEPFVTDDSKFRSRFGNLATPEDRAASETLAWARSMYGTAKNGT